jgi:hypothetical protein
MKMHLISNLENYYLSLQKEFVDKSKVQFSQYIDTKIENLFDNYELKNCYLGFSTEYERGWLLLDKFGFDLESSINEDRTADWYMYYDYEFTELMDKVASIINYKRPFPMEYVGKYGVHHNGH